LSAPRRRRAPVPAASSVRRPALPPAPRAPDASDVTVPSVSPFKRSAFLRVAARVPMSPRRGASRPRSDALPCRHPWPAPRPGTEKVIRLTRHLCLATQRGEDPAGEIDRRLAVWHSEDAGLHQALEPLDEALHVAPGGGHAGLRLALE